MSKQFEITEVVDRLIGDVSWHGETTSDDRSLENLELLDDVFIHLLEKLEDLQRARNSHPGNYSAEALAKKADYILRHVE